MALKRVSTREFLRNINDMTEPVAVYTRSTLKGTWYPGDLTWTTDMEAAGTAIQSIREAHAQVFGTEPTVPTSEPRSVRADAAPSAIGAFGASRPAPKPTKKKK
jgi:hypothetical protein